MEEKKDDECVINKFVVGCLICYRKNKRTNDEREREREREELYTDLSFRFGKSLESQRNETALYT